MEFLTRLIDFIQQQGTIKTISKHQCIITPNEVEKNLYFIINGAVRVFYVTEKDEFTIRLGYNGSIINSLSSFLQEKPSEFFIEAIRKTTFIAISKPQLYSFIQLNPANIMGYNALLELIVTQVVEREIDLLLTSPTERLKRVVERSPQLFQYVPLKYIAAYLRMSPETLSRIRANG